MFPFGGDFSALLNQPLDVVLLQLVWMFGWVPIVVVLVVGIMQTWVEIQRVHWRAHRPYILMAIDVPRLTEQSPKAVENIFSVTVALKSSPTWLETYINGKNMWRHSFELASINGYIQFYIWTEERYRDAYEASVYAQYPDAEISIVEDYVNAVPHTYPNEEWDMWGSEYTLDRESFFPLRTYEDFEHSGSKDEKLKDPLTNLFEGLAMMRQGEQMWFQIVTEHAHFDWKKEGDDFINKTYGTGKDAKKSGLFSDLGKVIADVPKTIIGDMMGAESAGPESKEGMDDIWKAFKVTEQEREVTKAVVKKISKPGLACKIRVVYVAKKEVFSKVTRKDIVKGTLKQLEHSDGNKFGGAGSPEDDYFWQVWWYTYYQNKMMEGYVTRSTEIGAPKFVLNIQELATLWHFPTIFVKAPLIKKTVAKRAEPPIETPFATRDEELLMAPSMNLPFAEDDDEEEELTREDLFAAPMSLPPSSPDLPPAVFREEASSSFDEDATYEMPIISSPTAQKTIPVTQPLSEETPVVQEKVDVVQSNIIPTVSKPRIRTSSVPDGIRVLIEKGIEPEDVGIDDKM